MGSPVLATDDDTLTYSLGGTDAASFDIDPATGQLQTKAPLGYETKGICTVTVTATDPSGESDTIPVTTILKIRGSGGLEGDLVAQTFQAAHRPASESCPVPLHKVVVPQVHEMLPVLDHAVDDFGDAVGHGHRRPLGPGAPGQPPVLAPQVGLGPSGGLGRLHQGLPS